jgi:nucleotide-binding universal stress UspA family protein
MRILYATDGSKPALDGVSLITRFVDPLATAITVLAVVPDPFHEIVKGHMAEGPDDIVREALRRVVSQAVSEFRIQGFDVIDELVEGSPAQEIERAAAWGSFDLIVVGAGSHSWLGRILLGSVSSRILRDSAGSVLVVHEAHSSEEPLRVLAGVDGSEGSDAAVKVLIGLADPAKVQIDVLGVAPLAPTITALPGAPAVPDAFFSQSLLKAQTDSDRAADLLRSHGFKADSFVSVGNPSIVLLNEVDKRGADLTVVGSRGLGAIGRGILGSVSEHIARLAPAALVVKEPVEIDR